MNNNNIKIVSNNDSPVIPMNNLSDKMNSNIKMVKDNNLKSNNINNSMFNQKPSFLEKNGENNFQKPVLHVPDDGLELLVNPKKTKNNGKSSESEYDSENSNDNYDYNDDNDDDDDDDENDMIDDEVSEISVNNNITNDINQLYNNDDTNSDEFEINNNNDDDVSNSSFDMKSEESVNVRKPPPRQKTEEEILQEKQELLYRLERFEKSGSQPSKKFTMNSKFEDIKFEYDRIKNQRDIDKSIKFQRKVLMAITSGLEFLNGKFDPFNIKLDGWSESIYENVNDYDEVFEELHEKYKEKVSMAPEIKLLMMVGGSAFMFHLSNTLFKSKMPGLDEILKQNPDLMKNVQTAAMNTMKNNVNNSDEGNNPMFNMMMDGAEMSINNRYQNEMKGPSGVDDILNQLQNKDEESINSDISNESIRRKIRIKKHN